MIYTHVTTSIMIIIRMLWLLFRRWNSCFLSKFIQVVHSFSLGVSGSLRIRSPMVDKLHSRYPPPSSSNCQACSPFDTCASVLSRCPSQSSPKGQACSPFDTCASVLELELPSPWILLLFNRVGVRAGVGGVQMI